MISFFCFCKISEFDKAHLVLSTPVGIDTALLSAFQHKQIGSGWHYLWRWETLRKEWMNLELGRWGHRKQNELSLEHTHQNGGGELSRQLMSRSPGWRTYSGNVWVYVVMKALGTDERLESDYNTGGKRS
jgi:hypothetical protein